MRHLVYKNFDIKQMYKVAFKNLGCKVNSYEIEKMRDNIPHNFYEVDFKEKADIYIINTCSVTHVADKKSRQMIHQAIKRNESAKVYVCGCYVNNLILNNEKDELKNVIYLSNEEKENVWEYVKKDIEMLSDKKNNFCEKTTKEKECDNKNENRFEEDRIRDFLKIEDGCDNFCSYCIIPYLRGRIQSRKIEDIIKDAKYMVKKGKKEIVLTGIDINAYGKDFAGDIKNVTDKKSKAKTNYYLLDVIKKICDIEGILRVRIGSLHPLIITDEFVKELKKEEKFCPEFHLSLQSGSDDVLKNMNRKYTTKDYEKAVNTIRKYYKDATITTDIIVGFPMESDKNFIETCDFVKKIKFYNPHIFKYSIRKGTKAANMPQVDEKVKDKREKELITLSKKISDDIRKKQVGKVKEVLIEEIKNIDGKKMAVGFTKEYMKVKVYLDNKKDREIKDITGKIIKVKIV